MLHMKLITTLVEELPLRWSTTDVCKYSVQRVQVQCSTCVVQYTKYRPTAHCATVAYTTTLLQPLLGALHVPPQHPRCMEATPSLACANKCVFCWRHHTNPVGKEWKWQLDEPDKIVNEALTAHRGMIKAFGGAPGVKEHRWGGVRYFGGVPPVTVVELMRVVVVGC